jgi:ankyrin repeat protein
VSSSSSGASPVPSSHSRRLTSTDGSAALSGKVANHKKQRDQNGRTRLARACAANEFDAAVARHAERPEDLNVPDNAGNTPLQIASLEGCAPIVKFLLGAGCEIDTKNIDKDTPLIDAVENGHLEVIKLLLDAGANPRTVNAEGDEPYDLIPSDTEGYDEIRKIISQAKANRSRKRPSEDNGVRSSSAKGSVPRAISATSPRDSPPAHSMMSPPPGASTATRRKTVRSEATRNDLLWTKPTQENLCNFAAKGDMAGVANVLNVIQKADSESLIAAAKGGHEDVMSLLLGMGDANPDPEPVQNPNCRPGYNTPMLAAIGRGNLAIIRLLLDQRGFNPTRRLYRGSAYHELAADRKGENWEEEAAILKKAYEQSKSAKKLRKTETKSPKRLREQEKDSVRKSRRDSSSPVTAPRRPVRSPNSSRHGDVIAKETSKTKDSSSHSKEKVNGASRPKTVAREDPHSEYSADPDHPKSKRNISERRKSDASSVNRSEEVPKRRRLIAGRPPQVRDKRRPSLMSTDSLSGREEFLKAHGSAANETNDAKEKESSKIKLKRARNSLSPERSRSQGPENGKDSEEYQKKKRRLQSEESSHKLANGIQKKSLENTSSKKDERPSHSETVRIQKDTPPEKRNSRPADTSVLVKKEQKKQDSQPLDRIPMDDSHSKEKGPSLDAKEASEQEPDTQMTQEEEEKRSSADIEKERVAKEEEENRKAAEQARLAREKVEEEERKRKEAEQRRIKQAEEDRQRRAEQERARLAKLRKEQEEQEQRRRDALPSRLRVAANLVGANDPRAKSHAWLKQFMPVVTARTRQLDPSCASEVAEELWVPNFLVAPLLATNDLQLSQYSSWEKRHATYTQRLNLWRVTRRILVQTEDLDAGDCSFGQVIQRDGETRPKYFDMEHVFWVKLSDFTDLVPHIPHLNGLELEFLKMHIDHEPSFLTNHLSRPQMNGNVFLPAEPASSVNGLTNGYGHTHHGTYV